MKLCRIFPALIISSFIIKYKQMAGRKKNSISQDSFFKGRFFIQGDLDIDGKYEGEELRANQLAIGKSGRVRSTIYVNQVVVEGIVIGDINAKTRVMLLPTARVLGDITTPELIIQNGVIFAGKCRIINDLKVSARNTILKAYREQ
ncbi:MAG TPA: polymer-forming cytoskeletal protein [Spirochaetota bacterium]|nr:polymer-forming cytoskeletal protein [Spirochaetota bacterium]